MTLFFQLKVQDRFNMRIEIKKARTKKKVLKQYPNARPVHGANGVQIMDGDIFIAEEYYMPATSCEDQAWEFAAIACRTTQNFNRTHPMKHDMVIDEKKFDRVSRRNRKKN